jgi:hypothetical protein
MNVNLFLKYLEINGYSLVDDDAEYLYKCNNAILLNDNVIYYSKNTSLQFIIYGNKIYTVMNKVGMYYNKLHIYLNLFDINDKSMIETERLFYNQYSLFKQKYLPIMRQLEKELINKVWHPEIINNWLESNKDKDVSYYEYLYAVG